MANLAINNRSLRRAALIAGVALLMMSAVAVFSNFSVLESLITKGDAAKTAQDILASEGVFRLGMFGWVLIAILDVVVAWALMIFFNPAHPNVSRLAAWFRLAYATILMVAISQLAGALHLLGNADYLQAFGTEQLQAEVMTKLAAFYSIWDIGLIFFALHLLLLGYLAYTSTYVPKLIGVLLVVAGLGYLVDSLGVLLIPDPSIKVTMYTFVGEAILFIWLLVKGRAVSLTK